MHARGAAAEQSRHRRSMGLAAVHVHLNIAQPDCGRCTTQGKLDCSYVRYLAFCTRAIGLT